MLLDGPPLRYDFERRRKIERHIVRPPDLPHRFAGAGLLLMLAVLVCLPSLAHARIDLSAPPPKDPAWAGPSLSLGRVGLDPCPGGYCRPDPNGNLFYFMTPHTRPIEPVPGVILHIPFGGGDR